MTTRVVAQLSVRRGREAVEFYQEALGVDPFGHHWEIGKPLRPWPPDCHR